MSNNAPTPTIHYPVQDGDIAIWTDAYFNRTRDIIKKFGDSIVTYAVFMRRPVICAPRLAVDWLLNVAKARNTNFNIEYKYKEGQWVGAGEVMLYISGKFSELVDLETLFLQRLGPPSVAAYNAFTMCSDMPNTKFLAMDARHCAGGEMSELMAYAASVGSNRAVDKGKKSHVKVQGFIGNATTATAKYFEQSHGLGTMPHALIGYASSTVGAATMFHETFPDLPLTVLVDYFGNEITDSLAICNKFKDLAAKGMLSLRLDTLGGRYCEGLDTGGSYATLHKNAPQSIRGYRSESELRHLIGPGVSAAAIWWLREKLNEHGFNNVKIVASSGFSPEKCRVMSLANAPVDVIGTGSFLPEKWSETYATADIIEYGDKKIVKKGREFLFKDS